MNKRSWFSPKTIPDKIYCKFRCIAHLAIEQKKLAKYQPYYERYIVYYYEQKFITYVNGLMYKTHLTKFVDAKGEIK